MRQEEEKKKPNRESEKDSCKPWATAASRGPPERGTIPQVKRGSADLAGGKKKKEKKTAKGGPRPGEGSEVESTIERKLRMRNLEVIPTAGRGHCAFLAAGYQIERLKGADRGNLSDEMVQNKYRRIAAQGIENCRDEIENIGTTWGMTALQKERWIQRKKKEWENGIGKRNVTEAEWGCEATMAVLSKKCAVNITILDINGDEAHDIEIWAQNPTSQEIIYVVTGNGHYSETRRKGQGNRREEEEKEKGKRKEKTQKAQKTQRTRKREPQGSKIGENEEEKKKGREETRAREEDKEQRSEPEGKNKKKRKKKQGRKIKKKKIYKQKSEKPQKKDKRKKALLEAKEGHILVEKSQEGNSLWKALEARYQWGEKTKIEKWGGIEAIKLEKPDGRKLTIWGIETKEKEKKADEAHLRREDEKLAENLKEAWKAMKWEEEEREKERGKTNKEIHIPRGMGLRFGIEGNAKSAKAKKEVKGDAQETGWQWREYTVLKKSNRKGKENEQEKHKKTGLNGKRLKIQTFNITSAEDRLEAIAEDSLRKKIDILGLQETKQNMGKRRMGEYIFYFSKMTKGEKGKNSGGAAIAIHKTLEKKVEIVRNEEINLVSVQLLGYKFVSFYGPQAAKRATMKQKKEFEKLEEEIQGHKRAIVLTDANAKLTARKKEKTREERKEEKGEPESEEEGKEVDLSENENGDVRVGRFAFNQEPNSNTELLKEIMETQDMFATCTIKNSKKEIGEENWTYKKNDHSRAPEEEEKEKPSKIDYILATRDAHRRIIRTTISKWRPGLSDQTIGGHRPVEATLEKNPKKKTQEKKEPGPLTKKYEREDVKALAQTAAKMRRRVEEEKKKLRKRHEKWEKSAAKGILKKETEKGKEKQTGKTNTETARVEIKPRIEILLTERKTWGKNQKGNQMKGEK